MNNLIKQALEDIKEAGRTVEMTGPLCDVFTNVLNQVYAKNPEAADTPAPGVTTSQPAMESQQLQDNAFKKLAAMLAPPEAADTAVTHNYGVSENEVTDQDVVDVTAQITSLDTEKGDEFILVMQDTDGDGSADPTMVNLTAALETIARVHGCKVYKSLKAVALERFH
jgi:hypothetical protein